MFVEIRPQFGQAPIRIHASQVIVYSDQGTPVALSSVYGPDRLIFTEHCENTVRFNKALQEFGIKPVTCEPLTIQ